MSNDLEMSSAGVATKASSRLYRGQTAIDFHGRRKVGVVVSLVLIVATLISLGVRGLDLGIDFSGGTSWDVPAAQFTVDDAATVLADAQISTEGARIQTRESDSGAFVKVQVESLSGSEVESLRAAFAAAAGVEVDAVNVNLVSASWGSDITAKAIRALIIFLIAVSIFISIRFEWRMAAAAIIAMIHDVVISVGLYSIFGFVVTPATVIAFLTILGYSLYDTIVVFDRIRENETRFATHRVAYADIVNTSMNQVIMRSINTSASSVLPVISLLLVGAGLLGASTLSEFAVALLIGMLTGTYSSIFVAAPLLAAFKVRTAEFRDRKREPSTGEGLRSLVMGASPGRSRSVSAGDERDGAATALQHEPRPRKKRRR